MSDEQDYPEEEIDATDYYGGDLPYDDKPHKPDRSYSRCWEYVVSLIESVSWQPLYTTTSIIGYTLTITLKENDPNKFSLLSVPLMVTTVVGHLVMSQWNPEQPLFNQLEEQDENRLSRLAIIMVPGNGQGKPPSDKSTTDLGKTVNHPPSTVAKFSIEHILRPDDNSGGNEPPESAHTYTLCCPACNHAPCTELMKLIYISWQQLAVNAYNLQQAPTGAHNESKPYQCTKTGCNKRYKTSKTLKMHERIKHPVEGQTKFKCEYCDNEYRTIGPLNQHQQRTHPTTYLSEFKCEYCNRGYQTVVRLNQHKKRKHMTDIENESSDNPPPNKIPKKN